MKLSRLGILAFLLPLAVTACSGDDTDGPITHEAGAPDTSAPPATDGGGGNPQTDATADRTTTDVVATPPDGGDASKDAADAQVEAEAAAPVAQLDTTKLKEAFGVDAKAAAVLPTLVGVIDLFVDGTTLSVADTAATNEANVNARLTVFKNDYCAALIPATRGGATPYVEATFPAGGCLINGLAVAALADETGGIIHADFAKSTSTSTSTLTVTFTLTDVLVNGVRLGGSATVTKTATTTTLAADFTAGGTRLTLTNGLWGIQTPDAGTPVATISGTGKQPIATGADAGTTVNYGADGWTCTQQGDSTYTAGSISRVLDGCYPSGGTLQVVKAFSCQKIVGAQTYSQTLTATQLLAFTGTKQATVTTDTDIADASTHGTAATYDLPWTCEVPHVDGGGVEAGTDAAPDTGTDAAVEAATDAAVEAATDAASDATGQ